MQTDHLHIPPAEPAPSPELNQFDQWCLLEIMGHQRYAGRVTEQTIGGTSFLRIHIPATPGKVAFTKFFSASSVYAITPIAEDLARGIAQKLDQEPISVYDLPEALREKLRQLATPRINRAPYNDDGNDDDPDLYDVPDSIQDDIRQIATPGQQPDD